jgi:hypothetical protein
MPKMIDSSELDRYQAILGDLDDQCGEQRKSFSPSIEELRMAPLIWWNVKEHIKKQDPADRGYAVLGHVPKATLATDANSSNSSTTVRAPVLLNTDSPWSAFLCGSQGSGKSHTLSCMLENCLLDKEKHVHQIGNNPRPLAGLVFRYDRCQGSGVCEAAFLCTDIPTTVLVSPSNYGRLKKEYELMAATLGAKITVRQLHVLPKYLDTERMKTLMAVGSEDMIPLYMQVGSPRRLLLLYAN